MNVIMEMLAHKDYLRILQALQHRPMRFSEIQKEIGLNPTQVDRALKFLRQGLWVVPRVEPAEKGRLLVQYEIGKRGAAFLESFRIFSVDVQRRRAELGAEAVAELESFCQ